MENQTSFKASKKTRENWNVWVPVKILTNTTLSDAEKLLLIYFHSASSNWVFLISELRKNLGWGKQKLQRAMKGLEDLGYLRREQSRRDDGKFCGSEYEFSYDPQDLIPDPDPPGPENSAPENLASDPRATPIYKERIPKERIEKKTIQKKDETPANAVALADSLIQEIKKKKPNFTGNVNPTWRRDCEKLLTLRAAEDVLRVFQWALADEFWCDKVLSPTKVLRHLDAIEMQMQKSGTPSYKYQSGANESQIIHDKMVAEKIKEQFPLNQNVDLGYDYLEFRMNRMGVPDPHLKFGTHGFEEQAKNCLRKMGLNV